MTRERSTGHIAFVPAWDGGLWEYWAREGEIWRQRVSAPVMPDGYRSGRWYVTDSHAARVNLVSLDAEPIRWRDRSPEQRAAIRSGAGFDL